MYIPKYFKANELVDRKTFEALSPQQCFAMFRPEALMMLDELRESINRPLVINDWSDGGQYEWSGLRTISCYIGAKYSGHRLGAAFDIKCPTLSPILVREHIRKQRVLGKCQLIKRMELDTMTWTHIDCIETVYPYLVEFKPE